MDNTQLITTIASSAVIGTIAGAVIANLGKTRLEQKKLIAGATRSALKREEMYYRVRRRTTEASDEVILRDMFHAVQEENSYYSSLLYAEAPWLGTEYDKFITAIKRETTPLIQQAWNEESIGPGGSLSSAQKPDVEKYRQQFAKDSKRFFNPFMRIFMRLRFMLRKIFKDSVYDK